VTAAPLFFSITNIINKRMALPLAPVSGAMSASALQIDPGDKGDKETGVKESA
jgi:hypothetical protein